MKHRQRGLTLVELMVTLAAAIILIAVGMPLFSGIVANNRAVALSNDMVSAFKLARSEAVKRTQQVTVCAIDDPTAAIPSCGAAADWSNGWTVFFDDGGSIDEHLRIWLPDGAAPTIVASVASVAFTPRGERLNAGIASLALTSTGSTTTRSHCLVVPASGQVRMRTFRPADGEVCP